MLTLEAYVLRDPHLKRWVQPAAGYSTGPVRRPMTYRTGVCVRITWRRWLIVGWKIGRWPKRLSTRRLA